MMIQNNLPIDYDAFSDIPVVSLYMWMRYAESR